MGILIVAIFVWFNLKGKDIQSESTNKVPGSYEDNAMQPEATSSVTRNELSTFRNSTSEYSFDYPSDLEVREGFGQVTVYPKGNLGYGIIDITIEENLVLIDSKLKEVTIGANRAKHYVSSVSGAKISTYIIELGNDRYVQIRMLLGDEQGIDFSRRGEQEWLAFTRHNAQIIGTILNSLTIEE